VHSILIVDDDTRILDSLSQFLNLKGYSCHTAENAGQALAYLQNFPVEVMLCDVDLPDQNGTELLREIKQLNPAVEVIMFTGLPSLETASLATKYHAFDYLAKPLRLSELLDVIQRALESYRGREQREDELARLHDEKRLLAHSLAKRQVSLDRIAVEFRSFAENSGDILLRIDTAGRVLYANKALRETLRITFTPGETQENFFKRTVFAPDYPEVFQALETVFARRSNFITTEIRMYTSSGMLRHLRLSVAAVILGESDFQGVTCTIQDRTDSYLAQHNLKQVNRNLRIMMQFAELINQHQNSETLESVVLEQMVAESDLNGALSWVPNEEGLMLAAVAGEWEPPEAWRLISRKSVLYGRLVSDQEVQVLPLEESRRFHEEFTPHWNSDSQLRVVLACKHQERSLRFVALFGTSSVQLTFPNVQLLQLVAKSLAQGIINNQLFLEVREAEQDWERTFNSIPDMVAVISGKRRTSWINRALGEALGIDPEEAVGMDPCELFWNYSAENSECPLHDLEQASRLKVVESSSNRFHRHLLIKIAPNTLHRDRGHLIIARDVTNEKEMLARNRELEQKLQEEARLSAIGLLASGIAHNLNSPLTSVLGYSELLLRKDPRNHQLKNIREQALAMKSIIENLLHKSRAEKETEIRPLDLNQLINRELTFLQANRTFKYEIRKEIDLDPDFPLVAGIYTDFSQTFGSVVNNAMEAMEQSESPVLKVATRVEKGELLLVVADTGCGMDEATRRRIFEPFFTTKSKGVRIHDEQGQPVSGGFGLGLSMVHRIMSDYGISIEVNSQPGKGTEFRFHIPKALCVDEQRVRA